MYQKILNYLKNKFSNVFFVTCIMATCFANNYHVKQMWC